MALERRDRRALLQVAVIHRGVINRTEKLRDGPPTIGDEAVNHEPSIRDDRSSDANLARHVASMWGGFVPANPRSADLVTGQRCFIETTRDGLARRKSDTLPALEIADGKGMELTVNAGRSGTVERTRLM